MVNNIRALNTVLSDANPSDAMSVASSLRASLGCHRFVLVIIEIEYLDSRKATRKIVLFIVKHAELK